MTYVGSKAELAFGLVVNTALARRLTVVDTLDLGTTTEDTCLLWLDQWLC